MTNYLLLLFLYIVWGTTYTAIPFALKGFTPFVMAFSRYLLVGLFFLPWTRRADWDLKRALPQMFGGVCLVMANSLVMWSQQKMPSGLASLFIATVPLWFMLVNGIFFEKKIPEKLAVFGVFLGLSGIGYLSFATGKDMALRMSALALVSASLIWVVGSLFIRRSMANYRNSYSAISIQMVTGSLFMGILASFSGESFSANYVHGNLHAWGGFLYLTVVGSLMALTVYNHLLKNLPPPVTGTYALVNPVVAMILGQIVLGEVLSTEMLVSTMMVLGGVGIILYSGARKA